MTRRALERNHPGAPVGYFTYDVADDRWSWSDGVYALHGYPPHAVPATTETLLRHQHPEDAAGCRAALERAVEDGVPFSCYHRIIDCNERVRSVLAVGRGVRGERGEVESVVGFYVDLTDVRREETEADVETALLRIGEHRPVIEQAKGALMFATGCDADTAFDLLRCSSMRHNVKLNVLARCLVGSIGSGLRADREGYAAVTGWLERPHADLGSVG
jgi:hypothetical protein